MKDLEKEFKPSSWAIDNRTAIYVLTLIISVMGLIAYNNLPKENFPEIQVPKIFIQTLYPGTSPENMEKLITKQIEKQLKSVQGLKKLTSNSYQDVSIITAEFAVNVDIKDAKQRIKDGVDRAKTDLPQGDTRLKEPQILDINLSDLPVMYVNISGDYDLKKLKEYADDIQERIEGFPEISKVDIVGALDREIQINVDLNKMSAAFVSFQDIRNAVGAENVTSSAGTVPVDGVRRSINIKMDFKSAEEIAEITIVNPQGRPIKLSDIAEVKDSFKTQESYARLYGKNVITLNIIKRAGQNLIEASDKIQALIKEMKESELPRGLEVKITGDTSNKTRVTLHDLINTIIIGFILVTVVLMFFMGVTNAIFVALSVPLSCFIAFLAMPALGGVMDFNFTMNMIVLFSFLLALGIVVDDAIVVIENTHRIFENGKVPIKKAAKMAAGEVFMPVLSGTLTTLAPFVPLLFWNSIIGEFMFFLPLTLIVTLLASLVVAYIINPVFAVDFMKPHVEHEHGKPKFDRRVMITLGVFVFVALLGFLVNVGLGRFVLFVALLYLLNHFVLGGLIRGFQERAWPAFQGWYTKRLDWFLHRPWTTLGGTFVLFILSIVFTVIRKPKVEFFPSADPNFAYVYIQLPVGTDQAYTNMVTHKVEDKVMATVGKNNPLVSSIISNVTVGVTDPQDEDQGNYPNRGKVTVAFVEFGERDGGDTKVLLNKIRESVKGIPGAQISVTQEQGGPPQQKPIAIDITGDNLDSLVSASERLRNYLVKKNIPGVEELKSDFQNNKPEVIFNIDRERANRQSVSTGQIAQNLGTAIYGAELSKFHDQKEDYEINVRAKEDQRNNLDALKNMKVTYRDMGMGGQIRQVPISSFADISYQNSYGGIKRRQEKRIIILSSNVLSEFNPNEVVGAVQQEINNFKAPAGVTIKMGGGQEEQAEAGAFLAGALLSAVGMIIIILILLFNSVGKMLIILSEILFSIIGVLLGLSIFNMNFSVVMTMIGIIALAGVVVRNGILLVEFSDYMIEQGMSPYEATLEAGRTRMTPVILTAIAAILGLIPLAVGLNIDFTTMFTEFNPKIYFGGDNVAFWGPLSWTMIFGLAFGTFITLILVPCMYLLRIKVKNQFSPAKKKTAVVAEHN
ncbi:efflux RND transporter permease subunit [Hufsiella ginkgonis]|uniref:MMPL family transporter n=1 Tax=Hufsiella ginkgonis TaxID=2695274 RepID=A0A7K1XWV4_9SPHI|nr:efflux RND transporter permease subunit [Hufsiella ginkgonis]MXV15461.1 MMPL family transporter [Hufsiella ginkgonis]